MSRIHHWMKSNLEEPFAQAEVIRADTSFNGGQKMLSYVVIGSTVVLLSILAYLSW